MAHYYNEIDKHAAEWLRNLIAAGLLPEGDVDERSIEEVAPGDLDGYVGCHFFAGIGGWAHALRLAGWPDDRPVWTGSCPCQPFSVAGKGGGTDDPRHLWPAFRWIIAQRRPPVVFGEQVASSDGREWLAGVRSDLEAMGYAVGAADLCAAGVWAPHIRQRLFWVADAKHPQRRSSDAGRNINNRYDAGREKAASGPSVCGEVYTLQRRAADGGVGKPDSERCEERHSTAKSTQQELEGAKCSSDDGGMGFPDRQGSQPRRQTAEADGHGDTVEPAGFWSDYTITPCADGKLRRIPTEPIFQLTFDGISNKMGNYWDSITSKLERWVIGYAEKTKTRPREVLQEVWRSALSEEVQRDAGINECLCEAEILLIAVCKLARSSQQKFQLSTPAVSEIHKKTLRVLWRKEKPSRPPQKRGLDRPPPRELGNAMYSLPSGGKTQQERPQVQCVQREIEEAGAMRETFSEMEEVWRSILDESKKEGNAKRLRADKNILIAAGGFPLAPGGIPRTASVLSGAGNAIVPQVAAVFVRAVEGLNRDGRD